MHFLTFLLAFTFSFVSVRWGFCIFEAAVEAALSRSPFSALLLCEPNVVSWDNSSTAVGVGLGLFCAIRWAFEVFIFFTQPLDLFAIVVGEAYGRVQVIEAVVPSHSGGAKSVAIGAPSPPGSCDIFGATSRDAPTYARDTPCPLAMSKSCGEAEREGALAA